MIRHRHVDTNGIRMRVAEAGPDDGPAVALCHGFPECWIQQEAPEQVNAALLGFLRSLPDSAGSIG